jgi:hypothetical protein
VTDIVAAVGTVVADTPVVAIAILVAAASVIAIAVAVEATAMVVVATGMGTAVVAGLVVHTMAVMGAIGVAVLVDCS